MKARLLKKWGTNYAGQVLSNVEKGSIPAGVAEFFEDDDPAVNTVVEQHNVNDPLMVVNDEINPAHARAHNEAQRARAGASKDLDQQGVTGAIAELEDEQTQKRAREADQFAAKRVKGGKSGKGALSEGQKKKNEAGKGHGVK